MIRNVALKKFFVNNISPIFSRLNKVVIKDKNRILIYCSNDRLKDNAGAVFDYLTKHEFYKKYKIVCATENHDGYSSPDKKRVTFIPKQFGIYQYLRSKFVFYSSGKIPIKPSKGQMVIFLTHGIPLKKSVDCKADSFFSYMSITSEFFKEKIAEAYKCPPDKICICGEPKTDKMFSYKENTEKIKLIIWTPTFRQSDYLGYDDSKMPSFLPFINNDEWDDLNEALKRKNVKIIAKLHPAQTLNSFTEAVYSNLEIYSDKVFRRKGMELYELLGRSNALIADYSSVYLEYLLLNRPIGFALADYEDYKSTRGFVLEDQIEYMPGKKIYNKDELYEYIDEVVCGIDPFKSERKEMQELFHHYKDGHNCERILKIAGIEL